MDNRNPEFPADTDQFPHNQQPDSADSSHDSDHFEDTLQTDLEATFNTPGDDPRTTIRTQNHTLDNDNNLLAIVVYHV